LVFGEATTGAQNDLERATEIAHKMVCEYGMSENLGPLTFGKKQEQVFLGRDIIKERNYSDQVAYQIDKEVRSIIEGCYERVRQILGKDKEVLDRLAKTLMEKEILESEEIDTIINSSE
jgi:cell division protease FtsH